MSAALAGLEVLGRHLGAVAVVGALLAAAALLVRRPLRRLPPRLQAWCWWLVAARLLLELAGAPAIELAWLPQERPPVAPRLEPAAAPAALALPAGSLPAVGGAAPAVRLAPAVPSTARIAPAAPLALSRAALWAAVGALWLAGVAASLARLAGGLRRLAGAVARATPVDDVATLAAFAQARRLAGETGPVALARSAEISTPLVTGFWRPTVLLPATARLAPAALRLVLLHELVHLRRHDGWRALLPALVRRLFFFHPLAVWAEREHALATEAACDAEVVARTETPAAAYGELLVEFTLGGNRQPRFAAVSSLAGPSIHRRLEMLAHDSLRPRQLAALAPFVALALVAVAAPVRLVAADATPTPVAEEAEVGDGASDELEAGEGWWSAPPPPPVAPTPATAPTAPPPGARWSAVARPAAVTPPAPPAPPALPAMAAIPVTALPALAPVAWRPPSTPLPALAPLPPRAPRAPMAPLAPAVPELRGADWLVLWERDAKLSIDAGRWAQRRAEELGARDGRPVLLLGRDGGSWVVRDAAAIDAIRQIFFEQREAAHQQAEDAREQASVAREQSRLAMEESRRALAAATRQSTFEADRVARLASLEAQRIAELQREIERVGGEAMAAAREQAEIAAREVAALERELARVREANDGERERHREAAHRELEAGRRELEARLAALDERAAESRRQMERDLERLERELERRLGEIFARGLAAPLAQ